VGEVDNMKLLSFTFPFTGNKRQGLEMIVEIGILDIS
jgi:hypothetical protein